MHSLVNAVWFKGRWKHPFDPKSTRDESFDISPQMTVEVPMMHHQARLALFRDKDVSVIELPYAGGDLAMIVILPKNPFGLAAVEEKLQLKQLQEWLGRMRPTSVRIGLPKFKLTWKRKASKDLKRMGMHEAFSPGSDFSGISHIRGLFISKIIHEASVEVNEEGTEAAAATAVLMPRGTYLKEAESFVAGHPFIFLICEVKSGSILFMGRVVDPKQS